MMLTPRSRLNVLDPSEIESLVSRSSLVTKYNQTFNRENLETILARRNPSKLPKEKIKKTQREKVKNKTLNRRRSTLENVLNSATSKEIGRTATRVLSQSLFHSIGLTPTRRRRRR